MKLRYLAVAVATALSFGANAGGDMKNKQSESGQNPSMSQGAGGVDAETLKQAQTKLNVTADGKNGPQTQKALKEFQSSKNLQVTGRLDQPTIAALGIESQSASAGGSAPADRSVTEQKPQPAPTPSAKTESSKQQ